MLSERWRDQSPIPCTSMAVVALRRSKRSYWLRDAGFNEACSAKPITQGVIMEVLMYLSAVPVVTSVLFFIHQSLTA